MNEVSYVESLLCNASVNVTFDISCPCIKDYSVNVADTITRNNVIISLCIRSHRSFKIMQRPLNIMLQAMQNEV